jgi:hypothetical protein
MAEYEVHTNSVVSAVQVGAGMNCAQYLVRLSLSLLSDTRKPRAGHRWVSLGALDGRSHWHPPLVRIRASRLSAEEKYSTGVEDAIVSKLDDWNQSV